MPIDLPSGILPVPIPFVPDDILSGSAVVGFDFELLDADDKLIGELDSVEGGSVDWTLFTGIKGKGQLDLTDLGQQVNWLRDRVRPVIHLSGSGGTVRTPLGVYIGAAPDEDWSGSTRRYAVDLLDKTAILEQDIVTDSEGDPVRYVAPVGANIVDLVVDLIHGAGEATPAIEADTHTVALTSSMVWPMEASVLTIINDLLEVGGYHSLWVDGLGNYQVSPYTHPANRDPIYSAQAPFTVGRRSVVDPQWKRTRDFYSVPNRYVAIGVGDEETEAPVAVVTNTDEDSPFSFQGRANRWVTRTVTGVEAASQVELEARAIMGMSQASSVTTGISLSHRFLPDLRLNSTIRFYHPDADVDLLAYVTKTEVPFDPVALCKTEIREAM